MKELSIRDLNIFRKSNLAQKKSLYVNSCLSCDMLTESKSFSSARLTRLFFTLCLKCGFEQDSVKRLGIAEIFHEHMFGHYPSLPCKIPLLESRTMD